MREKDHDSLLCGLSVSVSEHRCGCRGSVCMWCKVCKVPSFLMTSSPVKLS